VGAAVEDFLANAIEDRGLAASLPSNNEASSPLSCEIRLACLDEVGLKGRDLVFGGNLS
jgi:hypothetical protein